MSNIGVIVLDSKKILPKPELCATRLQIEDNIGEAIHVHWRNLRLDFSIRDFLALADLCIEIKKNFNKRKRQNSENNGAYDISKHDYGDQNLSTNINAKSFSIDPHFIEAMGDLVNHIVEIKVDTVPLDDLLSITYLSKDPNFWKADSIVESKPYLCLIGSPNAYEEYIKLISNPKYSKENFYKLKTSIEKNGYPHQNNFIVVFENEPYIRDGQHRAAILKYLYGNIRIPVLKLFFKNGYSRWRMNKSLRKKPDKVTMSKPQKIIWVRTDAIGDNILAASMLPLLKRKYHDAKIIVVCQKHIHEVYETCPDVDQIISFNKMQAYHDGKYRVKLINNIQELQASLTLNSVYSREPITDLITIGSTAKETVAFGCDVENSFGMSPEILGKNNQHYTKLIKSVGNSTPELIKYETFLNHIGIEASNLEPVIWLEHGDEEFAHQFFEQNQLQADKTIALFPGAQQNKRVYERYDRILQDFEDYNILILGGNNEVIMAKKIAKSFKGKSCVVAGKTTIRQTASIIKKCSFFLGSESCGAHIACAVGTPNIVIIGGGHFGRFMPYSDLTSLVCLPLDCYGCGWKCKYERPHCVKDISPDVIIKSVKETIEKQSKRRRIFIQTAFSCESEPEKPKWFLSETFRNVDSAEIIPVGKPLNSINRIEVNDYINNQKTSRFAVAESQLKQTENNAYSRNYIVSAIVSTYNAERFIRGCLEDLESQTIADRLEIVVVNSGSKQNEDHIIKEFQGKYSNIRYIKTFERESVYAAWNRGIKAASGKYVTNANTDDRHRNDAYEIMANVLDTRPDVVMVYADVLKTHTENETYKNCHPVGEYRWYDWDRDILLKKGCFIGPQPMWRRSVHDDYGYFDQTFISSGDFEFWLRISQSYNFFHIRMPLGLYLIRPDSIEHANKNNKMIEDAKIRSMYKKAAKEKKLIKGKSIDSLSGSTATNKTSQGGIDVENYEKMYQGIQPLLDSSNPEAAIAALKNLVDAFPDFAQAHNDLGVLTYRAGDKQTALTYYEKAVQLDPGNVTFKKNLADYYYVEQQRVEEALRLYVDVLAIEPEDVETLLMTGHICIAMQQLDDAEVFYSRVLEIEPLNTDAREILQKLQSRGQATGEPQTTEDIYPQSQPQSSGPDFEDTKISSFNSSGPGTSSAPTAEEMYQQAQALMKGDDPEPVIKALEDILVTFPDFALAHNDLGVLYYNTGKKDIALRHYEQAARLETGNITFKKNLADFYYVEQQRVEDALQLYVDVLTIEPQDVETLLITGHICVSLHKFDDAKVFYDRVLEIEPWNTDARQNLETLESKRQAV